jgi:hypothetical protein
MVVGGECMVNFSDEHRRKGTAQCALLRAPLAAWLPVDDLLDEALPLDLSMDSRVNSINGDVLDADDRLRSNQV